MGTRMLPTTRMPCDHFPSLRLARIPMIRMKLYGRCPSKTAYFVPCTIYLVHTFRFSVGKLVLRLYSSRIICAVDNIATRGLRIVNSAHLVSK